MKLIERVKRAPGVESFRFLPAEKLGFLPGQSVQIAFDKQNPNNKELNKYLSLSSSPTKDYIEVTKKLSESGFSQRLKSLSIGGEILLKAPFGNCVFRDDYKKIGFLIGGIGITPVISIIEYVMDKHLDTDIFLLYSNRTEDDIAFKKELDYWQGINKNIKICYVITDCTPKEKDCIQGRIDERLIQDKISAVDERIFFIFGPPKMVEAMSGVCLDLRCSKENVKTESFIGY